MQSSETFKCYKNSMLFDAQNAGNRISELLDFKFFWGGGVGMCPRPPSGKGHCGPHRGHSHLLHLQWPLITKVIEIPGAPTWKEKKQAPVTLIKQWKEWEGQGRGDSVQGVPMLRRNAERSEKLCLINANKTVTMPHGPRTRGILAHVHI